MRRPSCASYAYAAPAMARCSTAQSTSSAFSASAHPNEDWTKIADLAERRRIQNRIAQRNYRKKQRRRMEDLERRAGSSSASPPTKYQEPVPFAHDDEQGQEFQAEDIVSNRYTPSPPQDDGQTMFVSQFNRQLSASPPAFGFTLYPSEEQTMYQSYPAQFSQASYSPMPTCTVNDAPLQSQFLPQLPNTFGPSSGAMKYDGLYAEDDSMSPFSMSYAAMAGTGMAMSQALHGSSSRTPPLSDCFDSSLGGSPAESGIMFPLTPNSIPASSPRLM